MIVMFGCGRDKEQATTVSKGAASESKLVVEAPTATPKQRKRYATPAECFEAMAAAKQAGNVAEEFECRTEISLNVHTAQTAYQLQRGIFFGTFDEELAKVATAHLKQHHLDQVDIQGLLQMSDRPQGGGGTSRGFNIAGRLIDDKVAFMIGAKEILARADPQKAKEAVPVLKLDKVTIDGDSATAMFFDASGKEFGPLPFLKIDGGWLFSRPGETVEDSLLSNKQRRALEAIMTTATVKMDDAGNHVHLIQWYESEVTNEQLGWLAELTNVPALQLSNTQTTDGHLQKLRSLKGLVYIDLSNTKVTEAALKELKHHPQLENIHLFNIEVSKEAIADFVKANPNCKVETGWTLPLIQLLPSQFAEIEEAAEEPAPKLVIVYDVEDQQAADGLLDKLKTKEVYQALVAANGQTYVFELRTAEEWKKLSWVTKAATPCIAFLPASGGKPKILPNEISAKEVAQLLRMPAPK